jgi:hypothetical protein
MVTVNLRTWSGDRQICDRCGEDAAVNMHLNCSCMQEHLRTGIRRPRLVSPWHMIRTYVSWDIVLWYGPAAFKGGERVMYERSFRL